jgi:hypothetical protein
LWRFALGLALVAATMMLRPPDVKLADAARRAAAISARR